MMFLKFIHLSCYILLIIISCFGFVIVQATLTNNNQEDYFSEATGVTSIDATTITDVVTSQSNKISMFNHDIQQRSNNNNNNHHHHYLRMTSTRKNIEIYENEDEDTNNSNNNNSDSNDTTNNDNNNSDTTGDDYTYQWDRNHRFSTTATITATASPPSNNVNRPTKAAVLIVQDASPGLDEEVLLVTSKVNRAYAMRWGYDYLQFTGIAIGVNSMNGDGDNSSETTTDSSELWQATFNKPFLLSKLIQAKLQTLTPNYPTCSQSQCNQDTSKTSTSDSSTSASTSSMTISRLEQGQQPQSQSQQQVDSTYDAMNVIKCNSTISCRTNKPNIHNYDYVLFLDSSAIIVQLDYNILNLIQTENMIATSTPDLADVMLWNLNHPQAFDYSNEWMDKCYYHLNKNNESSSSILATILNNDDNLNSTAFTANIVNPIPKEMINGLQGTLVKQDMTYNYYLVDDTILRKKMPILNGISDSVCYRFYPQCEVV